ncbi:MAG TPA: secondary thiamine-phosphate synthase enzyme YjbQ [bacterium]|nr:secondary thiamine-phosphate synthase enzyme YjbQ [bacterium]HPN42573.1 secondary thiamine-phosphate synthase enzyme YjbQ [bacterium]
MTGARQFHIQTNSTVQFLRLDSQIDQVIRESGVKNGICVVFVPHTTAGVTINENADPDVVRDMVMELNKVIPAADGYRHSEGNSAAHIKSTLVGPSLSLIIENGRVIFGTWQSVYFCEFDGPRNRSVFIKVIEG